MTLDEQLYLSILERLVQNIGLLSKEEYDNLLKDITGNSHEFLKDALLAKGYLADANNYIIDDSYNVYRIKITDIGIRAYHDLKKKKCNELIQKVAFWILFAASIISAGYAVATYYSSDDTKNQQSTTTTLPQMTITTDTNRQPKQPVQFDTTNPKKNASLVDIAKQKDTAHKLK